MSERFQVFIFFFSAPPKLDPLGLYSFIFVPPVTVLFLLTIVSHQVSSLFLSVRLSPQDPQTGSLDLTVFATCL